MAKVRNCDSLGAVFPHFCPDKLTAVRSPVANFTFIGTTCRSFRAKNPLFGPLSKNDTGKSGMAALRAGLPVINK